MLRRQDAPPKFVSVMYDLRVTTDEPGRRVELVHTNLRKFGTVYNTLAAVGDVHGTLTATSTQMPSRTPAGAPLLRGSCSNNRRSCPVIHVTHVH